MVAFTLAGGSTLGKFGPVADNHNGTYTAAFTAGTNLGSATVTATINAQAVTATAALTVTAGPVSLSQSSLAVSATSVQAGIPVLVTLTARDAFGHPETSGGLKVRFTLSAGNGSFTPLSDKGNGTYTTSFTATASGRDTIIATINGVAVVSPAPTLTVVPGPLSLAQSTVLVTSPYLRVAGTTTVTLTTRDVYGNQETGGLPVTFGLVGGSTGTFGPVTDNHNGTYTATFTATTPGNSTLLVTVAGQQLTSLPASLAVGNLVVTTASDLATHTGVSLRDALATANTDAVAGKSDTIILNTTLMAANTIVLAQGVLELRAGTGTVTINGGGQLTISGNNASGVFQIDAGAQAVLTGLTVTAAKGQPGGFIPSAGISNFGTLTVSNSSFTGNASVNGGAISNYQGTLSVTNSSFTGNAGEAGAIYNAATLTVTNSTFTSNSGSGGARFSTPLPP